MKYNSLGKVNFSTSSIGFGAWGISGRDWGTTNDKDSKAAIHAALDAGMNFIDTADVYGFGHSESLIANVLKERGGSEKPFIATKAGNNFYPHLGTNPSISPIAHDYSVEHLVFAAEQSIKRLGVERLDLLQLHSPPLEILEQDEPWLALEKLKKEGKIAYAGWSVQSFQENAQTHILERHHELIDVLQVRYNLLEREAEEQLFPTAMKYNTGIITRIPILFGLLAGKFNEDTRFSDDDHRSINLSPQKLQSYLQQFEPYRKKFDQMPEYSYVQHSLRFCLAHPAVHVAIPGGKTISQVQQNAVASEMAHIPKSFYELKA